MISYSAGPSGFEQDEFDEESDGREADRTGGDPGEAPFPAPGRDRCGLEFPRLRILLDVLEGDLRSDMVCQRRWGPCAGIGPDALELGGESLAQGCGRLRFLVEDGGQGLDPAIASEGPVTGEHLIKDRPEGKDVGPGIDLFSLGLFGDIYAAVPRM